MELFPTQCSVDTWSILWSFGGLWLPVYELLQLFTDSRPLTAGHSSDHLQGFKVFTFSLNLVNHSESYMQDRAFLYAILSVMIANVAVSQGSDQTWCLLDASCQQRNSLLMCGVAKDELMELYSLIVAWPNRNVLIKFMCQSMLAQWHHLQNFVCCHNDITQKMKSGSNTVYNLIIWWVLVLSVVGNCHSLFFLMWLKIKWCAKTCMENTHLQWVVQIIEGLVTQSQLNYGNFCYHSVQNLLSSHVLPRLRSNSTCCFIFMRNLVITVRRTHISEFSLLDCDTAIL